MRLWRILAEAQALEASAGAAAPEGRFHHDGQPALYASLSPEGAAASITRYLDASDAPRVIVELEFEPGGAPLLDLVTDPGSLPGFAPDADRHRWDLDRAAGRRPVTWDLSDAARATGASGMIYRPRLRPDLANLVLFRWNRPAAPQLRIVRPGRIWPAPEH